MKLAAVVLLLLAGCAGQPPSFTDALGAGYATVDALARTTEELCGAPAYTGGDCVGSLSTDARDNIRNQLRLALELLDEARMHQTDGSADIAMQRVADARAVLAVVTKLLETQA